MLISDCNVIVICFGVLRSGIRRCSMRADGDLPYGDAKDGG